MRAKLTIGLGASLCWHITQGTPVSNEVAIAADQFMYVFALFPYAESIFPYSFSI